MDSVTRLNQARNGAQRANLEAVDLVDKPVALLEQVLSLLRGEARQPEERGEPYEKLASPL